MKNLLNRGISWPDQRGTPVPEARAVVNSRDFVRIEGQVSSSIGQKERRQIYDLPRSEETRACLEALLRFSLLGNNTWNFEHGELSKRLVWRWLRKHRESVIAELQPGAAVSRASAIVAAARALGLAATLRDRKPLRKNDDASLPRLLTPIWAEGNCPAALTEPMRELIEDLEHRHARLREFVVSELGAGQGDASPRDYIDPRALVEALPKEGEGPTLSVLGPEYHQGHWEKRFVALRGLGQFADLSERLSAEQKKVAQIVEELRMVLTECGAGVGSDLRAGFEEWLAEFAELIEVQRGSGPVRKFKFEVPHPPFDAVWQERLFQTREAREKLAGTLARADVLSADAPERCLTFDTSALRRLAEVLRVCRNHLQKLDDELRENEEHLTASGGSDQDALLSELAALTAAAGAAKSPTADEPN
jgi:hypothetical protein